MAAGFGVRVREAAATAWAGGLVAARAARRAKADAVLARAPEIALAAGAEDNGLAVMLGDLVRQNLDAKPQKKLDFADLDGRVAIVAEDAEVALTLVFERARGAALESTLTIHDGIVGIPDVTIRGPSEAIIGLSNVPLGAPLGLPFPALRRSGRGRRLASRRERGGESGGEDASEREREAGWKTLSDLFQLMRAGKLHFYGSLMHLPLAMRLTRVMSVNG